MTLSIVTEPVPLRTDEHGGVRVGNTRVTLEVVIAAFLRGSTAEGIVDQFPTLDLADVYTVLGFYLHNRAAVDAYIQQRLEEGDRVRKEMEAIWNPAGRRERLLARRAQQGP